MNPPVPFIVSHPRSGSTLLRLMLDAHPRIAIPPETMFHEVFQLARTPPPPAEAAQAVLAAMMRSQRWNDLHVQPQALEEAFAQLGGNFTVAEGLRAFYRLYAAGQGKSRFGDKTPGHMFWLTEIAELLPEAVFIHIIRDGRDIAASMRSLWFGPGDDIRALAESWVKWLVAGFDAADAYASRYLEIRYEELVKQPEQTMRRVLDFVDLPFDAAVLRHHERAADRLAELGELYEADGQLYATQEAHRCIHRRTLEPPNNHQVGRFRRDLNAAEIAVFEGVAGPMLDSLGYRL